MGKKSLVQRTLGTSPRIRILEYFLGWDRQEINISDLSRATGVSRVKVMENLKELTKEKVVYKSSKTGIVQYYKLNPKSPTAMHLKRMYNSIIQEYAKQAS